MWQEVVNSVLEGDFLLALFQVILAVVGTIINIILYPFGLLLAAFLPDLDAGLLNINQLFQYASTYIAWVIDSLAIPSVVLTLIAAYFLFTFTISFSAWTIKLFIKWKSAIW